MTCQLHFWHLFRRPLRFGWTGSVPPGDPLPTSFIGLWCGQYGFQDFHQKRKLRGD